MFLLKEASFVFYKIKSHTDFGLIAGNLHVLVHLLDGLGSSHRLALTDVRGTEKELSREIALLNTIHIRDVEMALRT